MRRSTKMKGRLQAVKTAPERILEAPLSQQDLAPLQAFRDNLIQKLDSGDDPVRALEKTLDEKLEEIRGIPSTAPPPGPPGWVGVRVIGELAAKKTTAVVPLPGVTVRLRQRETKGNEEERWPKTDREGVAYLELSPKSGRRTKAPVVEALGPDGSVAGTIHASPAGESWVAGPMQLAREPALGPCFRTGERWLEAVEAAEREAEKQKEQVRKELADQRAELRRKLKLVDAALSSPCQQKG